MVCKCVFGVHVTRTCGMHMVPVCVAYDAHLCICSIMRGCARAELCRADIDSIFGVGTTISEQAWGLLCRGRSSDPTRPRPTATSQTTSVGVGLEQLRNVVEEVHTQVPRPLYKSMYS